MTGPEVTPAVQRSGRAIWQHDNGHTTWPPRDPLEIGPAEDAAQAALDAALDVEEMATEADRHYASGYDGTNTVCNCGALVPPGTGPRHIATALRAAILGADQ